MDGERASELDDVPGPSDLTGLGDPKGPAVLSLNDKRPLLARVWPAAQRLLHSSHLAKIRVFLRGLGLVPPPQEGPELPWHPSLVHQGKGLE